MSHTATANGIVATRSEQFVNNVAQNRLLGNGLGTGNGLTLGTPTNSVGVTAGAMNTANMFQFGAAYGNTYNENTRVVYFRDLNDAATSDLSYDFTTDTITISGSNNSGWPLGDLVLTGATKRIGDSLSYLNDPARRTDVTVVFDSVSGVSDKVILEVFVATDPDVTPDDSTVVNPPIAENIRINEIMGQSASYFELYLRPSVTLSYNSAGGANTWSSANIVIDNLDDDSVPTLDYVFNTSSQDHSGTYGRMQLVSGVDQMIQVWHATVTGAAGRYQVTITYRDSTGAAVAYGQQIVRVLP